MTVRAFKIKWDEDLGPLWMNVDNLAQCLRTTTHTGKGLVEEIEDVTEQMATLENLAGALKEMCTMVQAERVRGGLSDDHPLLASAIETTSALELLFPKMFVEV